MRLGQELSDRVSLKGSVPQGSWLGPLLFIVLIDDLHPPCIMHKYMDDASFTVKVQKGSSGSIYRIFTIGVKFVQCKYVYIVTILDYLWFNQIPSKSYEHSKQQKYLIKPENYITVVHFGISRSNVK